MYTHAASISNGATLDTQSGNDGRVSSSRALSSAAHRAPSGVAAEAINGPKTAKRLCRDRANAAHRIARQVGRRHTREPQQAVADGRAQDRLLGSAAALAAASTAALFNRKE